MNREHYFSNNSQSLINGKTNRFKDDPVCLFSHIIVCSFGYVVPGTGLCTIWLIKGSFDQSPLIHLIQDIVQILKPSNRLRLTSNQGVPISSLPRGAIHKTRQLINTASGESRLNAPRESKLVRTSLIAGWLEI